MSKGSKTPVRPPSKPSRGPSGPKPLSEKGLPSVGESRPIPPVKPPKSK